MTLRDLDIRHYSARPIANLRHEDPHQGNWPHRKPAGFWVSIESRRNDGWYQYCMEVAGWESRLKHCYQVKFKPDARILWLKSEAAVREFTKNYAVPNPLYRESAIRYATYKDTIDWTRLVDHYHGIIISPYQYSCRLDPSTMWYYGWDCASGCIWDIEAIEGIELMKGKPRAKRTRVAAPAKAK